MSAPFTKVQPKDGDTVLHCGHLENKPHHFYAMSDPNKLMVGCPFTRPDGSAGLAKWMVLCSKCFEVYFDAPEKAMRADARWIGDEPEIRENVQ
jgi:hypothetical protein